MTTVGLIGAGKIGSTIARLAVATGYEVVLSNSRGPDSLTSLVNEIGLHARAATAAQAAQDADIAVVTIPFLAYQLVPAVELWGKAVIDTNNYYPDRDGHFPELDNESTTSSEMLQMHLPSSDVIKAFNHVEWSQLLSDGVAPGLPDRRALAVAGNSDEAKAVVSDMINRFGFDVVDAGTLAEGWRFQPGTPAYGPELNSERMTAALASARRYRDMNPHD